VCVSFRLLHPPRYTHHAHHTRRNLHTHTHTNTHTQTHSRCTQRSIEITSLHPSRRSRFIPCVRQVCVCVCVCGCIYICLLRPPDTFPASSTPHSYSLSPSVPSCSPSVPPSSTALLSRPPVSSPPLPPSLPPVLSFHLTGTQDGLSLALLSISYFPFPSPRLHAPTAARDITARIHARTPPTPGPRRSSSAHRT
jgi:hypothetical protein